MKDAFDDERTEIPQMTEKVKYLHSTSAALPDKYELLYLPFQ